MIKLPYGHAYFEIDETGASILKLDTADAQIRDGGEIVREAMAAPYGDVDLEKLAAEAKTCTLIISDHTRPVPSKDILPAMLEALRKGNPSLDITLLVATGCHRETTAEELINKVGREIYENEHIVVHDAQDPDSNEEIGILPSGAPLVIDKLAVHTDLLVSEGFIEPHFFAGYSGGRKSILPGVCDRVTVLGNHCGAFIADEHTRTGILEGNPIHKDMVAAAQMAGLKYIVNVVIDDEHRTVAAFAGDPFKAHEAGCEYLSGRCRVAPIPADIVITTNGGAPLDQNIYQCVKSMTAAEATAAEGGIIIVAAECADGIGGDSFYRTLRDCESAEQLYEDCAKVPQEETIPDQWQSQILVRVLKDHEVIFVTRKELEPIITEMKMTYAASVDEAYEKAIAKIREAKGREPSVTIIPNGISVMVKA